MLKELLLKVGKNHTIPELLGSLVSSGYEKVIQISNTGEFSHQGGIVKIYSPNHINPLVVDFFGDEIEKIYSFDLESGKKTEEFDEINILPNEIELLDNSIVTSGEYIVHEDHGVGIFRRIVVKNVEKELITYYEIEYLNNSFLYVPINQVLRLSKYIGVGRRKPKLNKLGSTTWKKNYQKIYEDVLKVARELLSIYAKRDLITKVPRVINEEWNKEGTKTFDFNETDDQKKAIEAVFKDLSNPKPMDRLLCGDVGFGKTEVALRAAIQSVANGYQVAILVPTTILAEQHFSTFKDRLATLPINIERLSRFVGQNEQKETIDKCQKGSVDILIGTHSILRRDINFKKLGLLIIDEEQKFGVKDKEKLKKFREEIDVLSLTATPIPRTLFMSLSGLRDISLISSVPAGRKSIETKVEYYDEQKVLDYIKRELNRSGQVYYLHNEVSTIVSIKNKLSRVLPEARIAVAHGQMGEIALARVMKDFAEKEVDVLVCSTIIENGLDLPNANTLIVDESDKFGLSQLYQIRGRIGRSTHQAYALFTYREKKITQNAVRRLKAIAENTELGTGYNLALEDLEIRGGGNILGKEQHGSMEALGLVLYSKLLNAAVSRLKQNG